jgi:hypothetical protein
MTAVDVLVGLCGFLATIAVVAGMILLTPHGEVAVHDEVGSPGRLRDRRGSSPETTTARWARP